MNHLNSDELIDAMEGLLSPERQAHLATCDACQRELAELSGVLGEAKQVSIPEPSPFFWNQFSERVRVAVEADAAGAWPQWLRWQVLAPLGAVAMIILGLMLSVPKQDFESDEATLIALGAPVAPDAPDNWVMVANLVGDLDLETASAAGVLVRPGDAELAVLELTADEQQELTRLLKAELMRAKS